ncbi:MAG: VanZ family protein [Gammaproteobacteria bacterium]
MIGYGLLGAFLAVLCLLSLMPLAAWPLNAVPPSLQKVMHVILYGVLAALLVWVLNNAGLGVLAVGGAAFLGPVGFGALMEWLQRMTPYRVGSWRDVGWDAMGAFIAVAVAMGLLFKG